MPVSASRRGAFAGMEKNLSIFAGRCGLADGMRRKAVPGGAGEMFDGMTAAVEGCQRVEFERAQLPKLVFHTSSRPREVWWFLPFLKKKCRFGKMAYCI